MDEYQKELPMRPCPAKSEALLKRFIRGFVELFCSDKLTIAMCTIFVLFILFFKAVNSTSLIDAIYIICGYTYGPLLGLFAYGLLTKRGVNDRWVPYIAVASPLLCYAIDYGVGQTTGYRFGYELLMLNGLITFVGLYLSSQLSTLNS